MASFTGSLAWQNAMPSVHAHAVAATKDFTTVEGHILNAVVGAGMMEVMITVYDRKLLRKRDEVPGANILQLECTG